MKKIWLQHYPQGVPQEIDPDRYASLADLLAEAFTKFADRPAFHNLGHSLKYSEIDRLSAQFAAYLQKNPGLSKGERVGIMMPNVLQYPVVLFGILRAGLVAVNFNPLYTAHEVQHQLADSGAKTMVVLANFAHVVETASENTALEQVVVTEIGDLLPQPKRWLINFIVRRIKHLVPAWRIPAAISLTRALADGRGQTLEPVTITGEDLAFLQYTGGTTGVAKGARLSHRNMVANILQATAWLGRELEPGKEKMITALPLYHIFSLTANCFTFSHLGGENILITNPRDIPAFIAELRKHRFSAITGVNTLFNALLHHPDFSRLNFGTLKFTLGGGMAVQRVVSERWEKITGMHILEAYGLTETSPAVTINPLGKNEFSGSIGLPIPSTEIAILDDAGKELGIGEIGELGVRGPQVTSGYWQRPDETARIFTSTGYLRTGDVARVDEMGFVYIVDRKKDMVLVSGFNVYPNEIEEVVAALDGVREVAAIGVPDPKSTETVKLFVVRKDPDLTAETIIAQCRKNLTDYKIPRYVEFRDELPKSNVGKILRRALREESS